MSKCYRNKIYEYEHVFSYPFTQECRPTIQIFTHLFICNKICLNTENKYQIFGIFAKPQQGIYWRYPSRSESSANFKTACWIFDEVVHQPQKILNHNKSPELKNELIDYNLGNCKSINNSKLLQTLIMSSSSMI